MQVIDNRTSTKQTLFALQITTMEDNKNNSM
jgi:hypothetical protein